MNAGQQVIKTPLLALPGPEFAFDFERDGLCVNGDRIRVAPDGGQGRGTGWTVWDGAVVTARHLECLARHITLSQGVKSILELGSGTGLAGLAAAACFKVPTVLTDLREVLPALERNVALNPHLADFVSTAALDWTTAANDLAALGHVAPHLVLASDCVWVERLVWPFVEALRVVCRLDTLVVLAYKSRSARVDELLFGLLRRHFGVEEAPLLGDEQGRGRTQVYHLRLLPGPVPSD